MGQGDGLVAVIHADESCLGNGREGENPGGSGSLIEIRGRSSVCRWDLFISAPDTTNNRMALSGAIITLKALAVEHSRAPAVFVSDSQYLIKGITEWAPGWRARGWKRKGGPVENLDLWKELLPLSEEAKTRWRWVRGHAGHPKNEYANDLAIKSAEEQTSSHGLVDSAFPTWLEQRRAIGQFLDYDPDRHFTELETTAR